MGRQPLALELALEVLHVLGDVDHHRAGAPGAGDLEGRTYRGLELGRIGHQEDMLGHRAHDRGHRGLLERIGPDGGPGDLPANYDNRYRICHAVAHGCNSVGGTGPGSHQAHPHLAARPRVAGRHESGALLVRRHDQRDLRLAHPGGGLVVEEDGVVGRQDRPAGVAEDRAHALIRQYLHDHAGAGHALARERVAARAGLDDGIAHGRALRPQTHSRSKKLEGISEPSSLASWCKLRHSLYPAAVVFRCARFTPCATSSPSCCRTRPGP